jgi:CO dehydrogenase/acetyl-CoA synthase delta subunit
LEEKEGRKNTFDLGLLKWLKDLKELELQDVDLVAERLEFILQPQFIPQTVPGVVTPAAKPPQILASQFVPPVESYRSQIVEVVLGATKSQGGTRSSHPFTSSRVRSLTHLLPWVMYST